MADAKPVSLGKVDEPEKKPAPKGVKKVETYNDMKDPKTGRYMRGTFELPNGTKVTMN